MRAAAPLRSPSTVDLPFRLLLLGFVAILKARNAAKRTEIAERMEVVEMKAWCIKYRKPLLKVNDRISGSDGWDSPSTFDIPKR